MLGLPRACKLCCSGRDFGYAAGDRCSAGKNATLKESEGPMPGGHGKREFFDACPSSVSKCAKGGKRTYSTSKRMDMCNNRCKDGRRSMLVYIYSWRYR